MGIYTGQALRNAIENIGNGAKVLFQSKQGGYGNVMCFALVGLMLVLGARLGGTFVDYIQNDTAQNFVTRNANSISLSFRDQDLCTPQAMQVELNDAATQNAYNDLLLKNPQLFGVVQKKLYQQAVKASTSEACAQARLEMK